MRRKPPRTLRLGSPTRRLRGGLAVLLTLLVVLAGRLVQLQGLDSTAYASQAEKQRLRTVVLAAPRGDIVDRDGNLLATSAEARAVFADPRQVVDPAGTARRLSPLLRVPAATLVPRLQRDKAFVYLARGLDPAVAHAVTRLGLPGIGTLPESSRLHPAHDVAANLVGFTGQDGHGRAGLESRLDTLLAGTAGRRTLEVGHGGQQIPAGESRQTPAVPGSDVTLTISRDLQYAAQEALSSAVTRTGAQGGNAVVLDVRTGEVLAMATAPTFDAARPAAAPPARRGNPPVQDVYEPGSVNKVITAAAALEHAVVTPSTVITVPPSIRVADKTFHDAHTHGTERLTFTGVLATSSNIGTIKVAQRVGTRRLYDTMRRFGFGSSTGIGFPGESAGIVPPAARWTGSAAGTIPIGQGVAATALQIASVYATVARGGVRVAPTLVKGTTSPDGRAHPAPAPATRQVISARTARQLTAMLEAVTTEGGTAPKAGIPGYRVAGKTGTARRVDPACGCYRGYVSSFVGFAPADAPRLVVEVALVNPRTSIFGGVVAAPVFRELMSFALRQQGIPPTGTRPPVLRLAPR